MKSSIIYLSSPQPSTIKTFPIGIDFNFHLILRRTPQTTEAAKTALENSTVYAALIPWIIQTKIQLSLLIMAYHPALSPPHCQYFCATHKKTIVPYACLAVCHLPSAPLQPKPPHRFPRPNENLTNTFFKWRNWKWSFSKWTEDHFRLPAQPTRAIYSQSLLQP